MYDFNKGATIRKKRKKALGITCTLDSTFFHHHRIPILAPLFLFFLLFFSSLLILVSRISFLSLVSCPYHPSIHHSFCIHPSLDPVHSFFFFLFTPFPSISLLSPFLTSLFSSARVPLSHFLLFFLLRSHCHSPTRVCVSGSHIFFEYFFTPPEPAWDRTPFFSFPSAFFLFLPFLSSSFLSFPSFYFTLHLFSHIPTSLSLSFLHISISLQDTILLPRSSFFIIPPSRAR
ncbi:hypothetical protein F5H01DRAFT_109025 [Linnemannia elongata]|nr:hypothetical protein F5H01DRAFT_109025 [Linnemannia elongata]